MKKTALLSVYDKAGIVEFARELVALEYDIISSGGTADAIRVAGIPCEDISTYTGAPEILGGRVKTLQYPIYGGILADRNDPSHINDLLVQNIKMIDIIVSDLYPFEEKAAEIPKPADKKIAKDIIEKIDVGGVSLTRAAAKNYKDVLIVTSPTDYPAVLKGLKEDSITEEFRLELAAKAFAKTSCYDALIADYLNYEKFPSIKTIPLKKVEDAELRYGENPHQEAALYTNAIDTNSSAAMNAKQLHGIKLSYNNYADEDAPWRFVHEYSMERPVCTIIKHNNSCGAAIGRTVLDAYRKSFVCDPLSAFGGIMAFNWPVDARTAKEIVELNKHFVECIIAPGYTEKALKIFKTKEKMRILEQAEPYIIPAGITYKAIEGGMLAQDKNTGLYSEFTVVTDRAPTEQEEKALDFAMRACKHTKSNAIIVARGEQLVGVGTGQQSRIGSLMIAIDKMHEMAPGSSDKKQPLVMASDAFFPFDDCVEYFASHGGSAVIWPSGSVKDKLSIDAANEFKMAMIKTGMRHFTH